MFKAIAFGLAVGAGIQAWRQWPADGPVTATSGAVALVAGVVCAYLAGRLRGRGRGATAVAVAEATAISSAVNNSAVNVWVGAPDEVASRARRQVTLSTDGGPPEVLRDMDRMPWMVGPRVEADPSMLLDGMDARDLLEELGTDDAYESNSRDW